VRVETPVKLRALKKPDIGAVASLEALCPEAAQWGPEGYEQVESGEIQGIVAERGSDLLGFIMARIAADELEILNLAVNPKIRRQGIATHLLAEALYEARNRAVRRAFLEVRESNRAARTFYQSQGFRESGRRKGYYSQPCEDAVIYSLTFA